MDSSNKIEYFQNEYGDTLGQKIIKTQYGFADKHGRVIIKPQYDYISDFEHGIAYIGIGEMVIDDSYEYLDGKLGIIDTSGIVLFAPQFDHIELYDQKIGVYRKGTKFGYLKKSGTFLTDTAYERAELFYQNLALVKIDNKYGFIDTTATLVIDNTFDNGYDFQSKGVAVISRNGKWGIINKKGKYILEPTYDKIEPFHEDIAYYKKGELYGILNHNGEIVHDAIFKDKFYVTDNYERVCNINDKWGLIDEKGRIVIELKYDKIRPDSERTKIILWMGKNKTTIGLVNGQIEQTAHNKK